MEKSHNASQDKTSTFKNLISQLFQKNGSLRDELVDFFEEQDTPVNNETTTDDIKCSSFDSI